MIINGQIVTDYWKHVVLEFRSDKGNVTSSPTHSQHGELERLRDDILEQLAEHESSADPLE